MRCGSSKGDCQNIGPLVFGSARYNILLARLVFHDGKGGRNGAFQGSPGRTETASR